MKQYYRSLLLLTGTVAAVSLYAFLGPDPKAGNAEKQLQTVVAAASVIQEAAVTDKTTGLRVLKNGSNEITFTSDIQDLLTLKLTEQLVSSGFFTTSSQHKMILGREPNNYILFYTLQASDTERHHPAALKKLIRILSAAVFNHQPVVVKVINEKKEVLQVII